LISGVKKIFMDEDTIIIQDTKRGGVFVFTQNGDFVKQINYIGGGPTEYHNANAVAVNMEANYISIYSVMSWKINKYTYQGNFIESNQTNDFMRDFAVMEDSFNIMINPCYGIEGEKNGVWVSNSTNQYQKHLLNDVPVDQQFEFVSTYYNQTLEGIYYYDRNYDNIYFLSKDSAMLLYHIDLRQRIPDEIRRLAEVPPLKLDGYAMMSDFCASTENILFLYYTFGELDNHFKWVLINRRDHALFIGDNFINDLDETSSFQNNIFYINDTTWCRVLSQVENDCNITLQFLLLK
jgi:hypothetical protein